MKKTASRHVALATGFLAALSFAGVASGAPLSLATCEKMALRANLDAAQAEGALRSAEAGVTAARAGFLPTLNVSGSANRYETDRFFEQGGALVFSKKSYQAVVSAEMSLSLGDVFGHQAATGNRRAARDQLLAAQQGVLYETAVRYYMVARQEELLEVATKATELSDEQLKKTRAMKDLGAATQADVYKAEVDQSTTRLTEIRARRDLRVARASLADLIGRPAGEGAEILPVETEIEISMELAEARERALQANPSLRARRAAREREVASVRTAKSARYPSLRLSGANSFRNFELNNFDDERNEWQVQAALNLTLFDGLLTKSSIRRAQSDLVVADKAVDATVNSVLFTVEQTYLDLEVAREAIVVGQDGVRSSKEDLRLAQERFKIGEGTILDVIDAQVNLRRALSTLVSYRYDARLAHAALLNAIGEVEVPGTP